MAAPMKSKTCLLIAILLLLFIIISCGAPPKSARVIDVIDGDTIIIEGGFRVRYIGIDTPELRPQAEPFAEEAWQANRTLIEGKIITLERDVSETDKYGRLLRYIWVDSILVNAELVKLGLAEAKAYPPDTKYQDLLEALESEAKREKRGIWSK